MTKLTFSLLVFIIIIGGFLTLTSGVFAQNIENPLRTTSFGQLIQRFTTYLLNLAAPLAVVVSLWAAILLMTAGGDPNKVRQGKGTLTWAVVGLAIILIAEGAILMTKSTVEGAGTPTAVVTRISSYILMIGGPLAIVMFLYGALLLGTSQPDNIKKAYSIFLWTAVAIAILSVITIANLTNIVSKLFQT